MCVIICVEDGDYPSKATLKSAESMNSDGGAIAWLNKDGTKSYRKGLKASKVWKLIQRQLKPHGIKTAIIHFRIASVGGVKPQLCHPFEIAEDVPMNMRSVKTTRELLFHNGTWSEYSEYLLDFLRAQKEPMAIPKGDYSDSRIMAYLAFHLGHPQLNKMVKGWNKIAILTTDGIVRYGSGWVNHKGNQCSNDYFESERFAYGGYLNDEVTGYSRVCSRDTNDVLLDKYPYIESECRSQKDKDILDRLRGEFRMSQNDIEEYLFESGLTLYDLLYIKEDEQDSEFKESGWESEQARLDQEERCREI